MGVVSHLIIYLRMMQEKQNEKIERQSKSLDKINPEANLASGIPVT